MPLRRKILALAVLVATAPAFALTELTPSVAAAAPPQAPMHVAPSATIKLPKGVAKAWSNPSSESLFTGPKDKRFVTKLKSALNAAPAGATVRASTYAVSDKSVVKAFISAKHRGVNVRFTTWTRAKNGLIKKLQKALGTNTNKPSYVKLCKGSCYAKGADRAAQHAKVVTVSSVYNDKGRQVSNIVFVTSANFSKRAVTNTWNHSQLIVGCAKIYQSLATYMDGMKYDKTKRDFKPVSSCGYTLYLFPSTRVSNPAYEALKSVKCQATKKTKTIVRVMMYVWSGAEMKAVRELARMKGDHCDVGVIITSGTTSKSIIKALKKAKIPLYNSMYHGRYLHAKVVAISGKVGKKLVDSVWSGSANFSWSALARNTDTQLRSNGKAAVNLAFSFFDRVAKASNQLYPKKKKK